MAIFGDRTCPHCKKVMKPVWKGISRIPPNPCPHCGRKWGVSFYNYLLGIGGGLIIILTLVAFGGIAFLISFIIIISLIAWLANKIPLRAKEGPVDKEAIARGKAKERAAKEVKKKHLVKVTGPVRKSKFAISCFVLGMWPVLVFILAIAQVANPFLTTTAAISSFLAIIFSIIAFIRINKKPELTGANFAIAGFILGIIFFFIYGITVLAVFLGRETPAKIRDEHISNIYALHSDIQWQFQQLDVHFASLEGPLGTYFPDMTTLPYTKVDLDTWHAATEAILAGAGMIRAAVDEAMDEIIEVDEVDPEYDDYVDDISDAFNGYSVSEHRMRQFAEGYQEMFAWISHLIAIKKPMGEAMLSEDLIPGYVATGDRNSLRTLFNEGIANMDIAIKEVDAANAIKPLTTIQNLRKGLVYYKEYYTAMRGQLVYKEMDLDAPKRYKRLGDSTVPDSTAMDKDVTAWAIELKGYRSAINSFWNEGNAAYSEARATRNELRAR